MRPNLRIGETQLNPGGKRAGDSTPARFDVAERINSSVKEASDIVALPNGQLAVVSDTKKSLRVIWPRGSQRKVELQGVKGTSQYEGVAYDPVKQKLFVSREEKGEVLRYAWKGGSDAPKLEAKIEMELSGPANKGIEGLAYLPAAQSPTGEPQLIAAKEGSPRQLLVFRDSGKGEPLKVELESQLKDVLKDFSAVAIDPKTGNLFLSSDESSVIAQVRLVRDGSKLRARLIQAIPIRNDDNKPLGRIEGITFNARGDLFVLTENDGAVHELRRK